MEDSYMSRLEDKNYDLLRNVFDILRNITFIKTQYFLKSIFEALNSNMILIFVKS